MTARDLLITLALMALWGFNFSAIKLGADRIDPMVLTALRFSFAIFPVIFFIPRPSVATGYLVAYGLTFGVGIWGMMVWSIQMGVSAGMAGLLMDMSLISSMLLGYWVLKERIALKQWIGAALAVIGLMICLMLTDGSVPINGLPLCLIAAFSWSLMSLIVKKSGTTQVFAFSVWGMAFAPLPLALLAYLFHGAEAFTALPGQFSKEVWFSILFQAYPTTLLGYWIWNRMTLKYPLSTMAPFTLLTPVFGLIGSHYFFAEQVSTLKLLAFVCILGGLAISQWQPWGRAKRPIHNEAITIKQTT
ncbi:EamA family transporter [Aestuariirhabdus sp. Z084]|uniref:EamA family transporter n=1 Tax=Aestuariirhabdus haliotis TaxID=2918751 RepID=UPI00201B4246|nr:EamA family transporter [Aestuariirhabdus haliotis]MCL6415268.1 EamA family transporter [Aestuariirhabdus haliotis]MCL6419528.1 EamA family transporter [Aestuariirhabdus haliotis]